MYKIIFYTDKNGRSEIFEYIEDLRKKKNNKECRIKVNKITAYINQLSIQGLSLGEPYIKRIDSDLWELRTLRDRIFFASCENNKLILLSVFMKNSNKTPEREKEKVRRRLDKYKNGE